MSGSLAANVDIAVVRVATEPVTPAFQLPIQFGQEDIGEQGRERAALRRPFSSRADHAAFEHTGLQVTPDQRQYPAVGNATSQQAHQHIMIDPVKELRQIHVNHPAVAVTDMLLHRLNRPMGTSTGAKPVAVIRKGRFQHRAQYLMKRLLDQAILYRRDTQYPLAALRLGNADPAYRLRMVVSGQQPLTQRWPVLLQVALEGCHRHLIDTSRALIGYYPLIRTHQVRALKHLFHQRSRLRVRPRMSHRACLDTGTSLCRIPSGASLIALTHPGRFCLHKHTTSTHRLLTVNHVQPFSTR